MYESKKKHIATNNYYFAVKANGIWTEFTGNGVKFYNLLVFLPINEENKIIN